MQKNLIIFSGGILLLVLVATAWFFLKDNVGIGTSEQATQTIPTEDAIDVTLDFYNSWLDALQSTTTDPYQLGLLGLPILSTEVRADIDKKHTERQDGDLEPVVCQLTTPKRVGGKAIYAKETEAQIMVLARGEEVKSPYMAIVTLEAVSGAWQIKDIACTQGEVGPEAEFDFEHSGFLLKQSVPAPLDSQYWHLVYEETDGQTGYTARLYFNPESICISKEGVESVCTPDTLTEATKVFVSADMTEEGGVVKKMRFE